MRLTASQDVSWQALECIAEREGQSGDAHLGALVVAEAQLELCLAGRRVLAAHARLARHAAQRGHQLCLLVQLQPVLRLQAQRHRALHTSTPILAAQQDPALSNSKANYLWHAQKYNCAS